MQTSALKTPWMLSLVLFLGLVSRDLNTHHPILSWQKPPTSVQTLALRLSDHLHTDNQTAVVN